MGCLFAHRGKPGWHSGAVFEAPALVAGFDDLAMMGQAIEERRRHLGVAKYTGPIAKGQVGGDDDRGALIEPVSASEAPIAMPSTSRRPSLLTATATMTATETMRPLARTFT